MDPELIIQGASLIVYAMIVLFSIITLIEASRYPLDRAVRWVVQSLMLMTLAMAAVFSTLQALYILNRSWAGLPLAEVIGWVAHDWANGLTHLAFVLATRVFVHRDLSNSAPPCLRGETCHGHQTLAMAVDHERALAEIQRTLADRMHQCDSNRRP